MIFMVKYIRRVLNFLQLKLKFLLIRQDIVSYEVGEKIAATIIEDREKNKRKYIDDKDLCRRVTKFSLKCISY
ncbi:hypothetical protein RclHR1_26110002 [Rhizophagus clarus]|uniref:Uncharacterized protein n=1 Tax=Rhizophagus clarus TaxID=94130 RepID=A0A2Z6R1H1_9GLOM|nr:hypothetical protein RclHR1_26110002 [Rhizophagus clarus]